VTTFFEYIAGSDSEISGDRGCGTPHLGVATTRELLAELEARFRTEGNLGAHTQMAPAEVAQLMSAGLFCKQSLASLPEPVLRYRTVGPAAEDE